MVANNTKIYLKKKKKKQKQTLVEYRKKWEKNPYYNYKKLSFFFLNDFLKSLFGWRISGCFEDINLIQIAYLKKIVLKGKADLNGKKVETYELKTVIRKSKNGQKNIKFDDTIIDEYEFHWYKSPISLNDIDINNIVVPNKLLFGKQDFEYFVGYKDSEKIVPLCIFHPQMVILVIYKRNFDENRWIYFLIKEEKAFIKYMEILEKS